MSDPIRGSGRKGFGFEKKGFQDRNLLNLLTILSKKETQKAIEDLSKIKKDEWKAMAETATMLNSFVTLGGNVAFFNVMQESIKETIRLQIESLLSPLTNEINQAITDLLTPFLTEVITPIVNDITTFFSENAVGTGAGGIAGAVIGAFLGSPAIGAFIGAIVGAAIENYFVVVEQPPIPTFDDPALTQSLNEFLSMGGTIAEWLALMGLSGDGLPAGSGRLQENF